MFFKSLLITPMYTTKGYVDTLVVQLNGVTKFGSTSN
jgi:hypothetical protein